jgi:competence ComEA-like helix-hairpin-helix protein
MSLGSRSRFPLKFVHLVPFSLGMSNTLPYGDPEASPVDLNTACIDDLCSVPGIGPSLAQRIVSFRAENGPFSDPSELLRVPRIGSRIAARVSERVAIYGRTSSAPGSEPGSESGSEPGSESAIPHALGTFASPPPPNVTVEGDAPEPTIAPPPSVPAPQVDVVARIERRHKAGLGVVCVLATMTGLFGGYCLTQATARHASGPVTQVVPVATVEAEHREIRVELERQAADLSSTTAAIAKVAARQTAFEAETHASQAHLTQDMSDLAERTRKAQARTEAKVYKLNEAMKLIDWATSGGYATKATASLP